MKPLSFSLYSLLSINKALRSLKLLFDPSVEGDPYIVDVSNAHVKYKDEKRFSLGFVRRFGLR